MQTSCKNIFQTQQYFDQKVQQMRRPQSAKPGHKGFWGQGSSDDFQQQDNNGKGNHRKNIKLMKPDLTTNDFARILPKKIYQDKERLYSQGLQLKQNLNETLEENIRMKTRITILEKQKDKLQKHLQMGRQNPSMNKTNSRVNIYPNKNNEVTDTNKFQKQNMMIRNLKKMIRQGKEENEYLKQENAKIKKAIKYTKINQLEIQRKMLQQQNRRIATLLEQMNEQLANQESYERQINDLKRYLDDQQQANRQLNDAVTKYMEYIQQLQQKMATDSQKAHNKENKLQRDAALNKRKMNEALRQVEDLRKQINALKQNNVSTEKKKPKLTRPVTSHPYKSSNSGLSGVRMNTDKKQEFNKQNEINLQQIKLQNQQLKSELDKAKNKLQETERQMAQQKQKSLSHISKGQKEQVKVHNQSKKQVQPSPKKSQEDDYSNQYEDDLSPQKPVLNRNQRNPSEIEEYKKDFQAGQEEEPLYIKQDQADKKKAAGKKKAKSTYKPDKKFLTQIKQLLTYRMKGQRYTYQELKNDIVTASQKNFNYLELKSMLSDQPFYLTQNYAQILLQYFFQKQKIKNDNQITNEVLLTKLRKVIEDFVLIDQKQQEQMMYSIAETVTQYPQQLEASFQRIKNGQQTVARQDFIELFEKLQMDRKYIEIMIQELSLCSTDLEHLNFHAFFQRFYVQELEGGLQNVAIDQEQLESSGDQNSRNLKPKDSKKLKEIRQQFQDNDDNLVIDDGQKISLGNQDPNQQYQQADIVSDDAAI